MVPSLRLSWHGLCDNTFSVTMSVRFQIYRYYEQINFAAIWLLESAP